MDLHRSHVATCDTFLAGSLEGELRQAAGGALGAMAPGAQDREGWWELHQWLRPGLAGGLAVPVGMWEAVLRRAAHQGVQLGVVMDPDPDTRPCSGKLGFVCDVFF